LIPTQLFPLFYFFLLFTYSTLLLGEEKSSKEIQKDIDLRKTELQSLRNEIKDIEERLHLKNKEAISSTEILLDLENKINLTEKLIRSLNKEDRYISELILTAENQIQEMETLLIKLKNQLTKRLQYLYVYGRPTILETVLLAEDWNNAIYRIKYLDVLAEHEKKLRKKMKQTLIELAEEKAKLLIERNRKTILLNEKKEEGLNLERDKKERKILLVEIKKELEITLKKHKSENRLLEAQRLEERTRFDLEMIEATGTCAGIENYSRFLSGRKPGEPPPTLFEYFPDNTLIFVDECHVTVPQLNGMYKGDRSRKSTLAEYGFRLPSCMDNRPLKFQEWDAMRTQTVFVSATPGPWELEQVKGKFIEQVIRPTGLIDPPVEVRSAKNQVDDLMHECRKTINKDYRVLVTTLTKKMAEDLTEYLHENGIKVRYMHSDIDTLERIEIMRDLRLGVFDVLVGINLLREGLDIPECGLVAILDADKEGFLRSERSLIQTVGRAARNLEGKAILYADKKTKSIEKTIQETDRRRKIQEKYNKKNNITATSIKKGISDILESVYEKDYAKNNLNIELGHNLKKHLKALKKRMKESAENLEFEEAAKIRDEIRKLEASELEIGINPKLNKSKLNNRVYPEGRSTQGKPGTRPKRKR